MNSQKRNFITLIAALVFTLSLSAQYAKAPRFRVLALINRHVEKAHVDFADGAIAYFNDLTIGKGFYFDVSENYDDLNTENLKKYDLVIMLNDQPHNQQQRDAFREYMENGGGWMGFHVAAYNDRNTKWPWFLEFLGGGVFHQNNWPAMPAKLVVDNKKHPVTKGLPSTFIAPENEWYQWEPSPRKNKNIEVLLSLSTDNYPFGIKDIIPGGDTPVVWTNKNYRMIYLNIGHGAREFGDATQNYMILNAFKWVLSIDKKGNPFEK